MTWWFPMPHNFSRIMLLAVVICLIDVLESISIAKALAYKNRYELKCALCCCLTGFCHAGSPCYREGGCHALLTVSVRCNTSRCSLTLAFNFFEQARRPSWLEYHAVRRRSKK